MDSCDIKMEYTTDTEIMDVDNSNLLDIKPDCIPLKDNCASGLKSLKSTNLVTNNDFTLVKLSDGSDTSSTKKVKKLLDYATLKEWLKQFYPTEDEPESELDPIEEARIVRKRLKEHAKEVATLIDSYVSYNETVSTESDDHLVDTLTPSQKELGNLTSYKNKVDSYNNTVSTESDDHLVDKFTPSQKVLGNLTSYKNKVDSYNNTVSTESHNHLVDKLTYSHGELVNLIKTSDKKMKVDYWFPNSTIQNISTPVVVNKNDSSDDELWNIEDEDSDSGTIGNGIKVFTSTSLTDAFNEAVAFESNVERDKLEDLRKCQNPSSDPWKPCASKNEIKQDIKPAIKKESNFLAVVKNHLQDTSFENGLKEFSCSNVLEKDNSNISEGEKKALALIDKSSDSSSEIFCRYKEIVKQEIIKQEKIEQELIKQEMKKERNFPAKKKKYLEYSKKLNSKKVKSKIDKKSINLDQFKLQLEDGANSELGEELILNKSLNEEGFHKTNVISLNSSDSLDLQSNWTNLPPGPSFSTDLSNLSCSTSLSSPTKFSKLVDSNSFNPNSHTLLDENAVLINNSETRSLFNFYNTVYNNPSSLTEISEENIEVSPLEECILIKELSKPTCSDNSDEELETENSDRFLEDPDIVNPDILYNIDLNEYIMQMELLVQKFTETPDDPTVLTECMQLSPIPENEHGPLTFTAKERFNFANGISEYEYDIDTDDWNKIMVKRAVVFTAHAGFTIANEESLYVLADVAIDYIKKLAVLMKNNFDHQENSSYPHCIDPINNSLIQIGVKGGITELIRHYENDVFERRDKLIMKCHHLKKIIDQYIERMQEDPISETVMEEEEIILKEEATYMETITEEDQTEILSTIEEVEIETQTTPEDNVVVHIESEQIEPTYNEQITIDSFENIQTELMDSCDIKMEYTTDTEIMDVDISKLLYIKPDCIPLKDNCASGLKSLKSTNLVTNNDFSLVKLSDGSDTSSSSKKVKKLLDFATLKEWLKQFYPTEDEPESELDPIEEARIIRKRLKEHANEFATFFESYISYNNSIN